MKQLYLGTYVFEICNILEISSWFFNEIMILEMIYRNRKKKVLGEIYQRYIFFIMNTKRQNPFNCPIVSLYIRWR
jgi:hypothetical protein